MRRPSARLRLTLLAALPLLAGLTSCETVSFYEKQTLSSRLMRLDVPATEANFYAKSTYSREGSVGGIGSSAGGGCGCY